MTATMMIAPVDAEETTEGTEPSERTLAMTYEEYLASTSFEGRTEWVDGRVIVFIPPNVVHARINMFLATLMRIFARRLDLGEVIGMPMEMRILDPIVSREPDILFVASEHIDRITSDRLDGPADLVVEFISKDSIGRDRGDKFYEYERAGIGEYWIADPRPGRHRFDAWVLGDDEKFRAVLPDDDGRYHSTILKGFWLRPEWLWQDPLPEETVLLDEILRAVPSHA